MSSNHQFWRPIMKILHNLFGLLSIISTSTSSSTSSMMSLIVSGPFPLLLRLLQYLGHPFLCQFYFSYRQSCRDNFWNISISAEVLWSFAERKFICRGSSILNPNWGLSSSLFGIHTEECLGHNQKYKNVISRNVNVIGCGCFQPIYQNIVSLLFPLRLST